MHIYIYIYIYISCNEFVFKNENGWVWQRKEGLGKTSNTCFFVFVLKFVFVCISMRLAQSNSLFVCLFVFVSHLKQHPTNMVFFFKTYGSNIGFVLVERPNISWIFVVFDNIFVVASFGGGQNRTHGWCSASKDS